MGINQTFCQIIDRHLPASCNCTDVKLGGSVNCKIGIIDADRFGLQLDVMPCDKEAAHVDIAVTESTHHVNFTVAGIEAGTEEDIPIPGLAVGIPKIGNAGVVVAVKVQGDLDNFH